MSIDEIGEVMATSGVVREQLVRGAWPQHEDKQRFGGGLTYRAQHGVKLAHRAR